MEVMRNDFQNWTRLVYGLIRAHHYRRQMGQGLRANLVPPAFRGLRDFLSRVASPASPTTATATLLRANASNWLQTDMQILEQHYEEMIAGIKTNLLRPVRIDHHRAWLVAVRRAVNNFKVGEEVLTTVMNDLIGVGVLIQQIPEGSPMRAIQAAPAGQPRQVTDQGPETTTPETPTPGDNTTVLPQLEPDDQTQTCSYIDLTDEPETETPCDQDTDPNDQDPSPIPGPTTRRNPLLDAKNELTPPESTGQGPPHTSTPAPSHILPPPY